MNWSILLVDDEPRIREIYRLMLTHVGFEVFEASDGFEALEKVKDIHPDVMVLDAMMPDMDGVEVCKKIRSQTETADLPIIMFSGKGQPKAITEGIRAGVTRYLTKPVSLTELTENIRQVLCLESVHDILNNNPTYSY